FSVRVARRSAQGTLACLVLLPSPPQPVYVTDTFAANRRDVNQVQGAAIWRPGASTRDHNAAPSRPLLPGDPAEVRPVVAFPPGQATGELRLGLTNVPAARAHPFLGVRAVPVEGSRAFVLLPSVDLERQWGRQSTFLPGGWGIRPVATSQKPGHDL